MYESRPGSRTRHPARSSLMWLRVLVVLLVTAVVLPSAPASAQASLSRSVYDYMATRRGTVTVAVFDLVADQRWWWHVSVRGYTASIVKVDILAALMHRQAALTARQRTLATAMIERSDNSAATTLYRAIGGAGGLRAFDTVAGLATTTPSWAWGMTTTSSLDQVRLLTRLAQPNDVLTPAQRSFELGLMAHVVSWQRWGVTAGVPADVAVSLKNGWLPLSADRGGGWQVNSIGYVHGQGRRYVIAVLTHSPSFDYGVRTVSGVSRIVWPHMARAATP